ncbi:hypothetical protein FVE67_01845 [Thermosulfurimonas marina]|uniref:Tetrahaem cytochrome domain-containing protein n=1 Tax=Thermosulfurimonas marina TaxID=2047767 RepID=A0A6H1WR30_9BACT|nr:cytochrome c3 family protein [Thermosulfurimonas marina]QJA05614.1 hypothetical protein FVE67_01845 [Thermosulfurimonas marina]
MRKVVLLVIFWVFLWVASGQATCKDCHPVKLDSKHAFSCEKCHAGDPRSSKEKEAHQGLIARPAHPRNWERACGRCHARELSALRRAPHYTLAPALNTVLSAFGLPPVKDLQELPEPSSVRSRADLLYDLLRRRCLKCHLFSSGEAYSEARRGTGCAACHLLYAGGKLADHRFQKPSPRNCLHCHYGNRVGWDYYGFFAHDLPHAFRTPLVEGQFPARPWGIEFHEMTPDLHAQRGLSCTDCHGRRELMESGPGKTCLSCHEKVRGRKPFHTPKVLQRVRCESCHAVWMARDEGLYFTLYENPDWEEWQELWVQEDAEIEALFREFFSGKTPRPFTTDKLSGKARRGVWFLTLKRRRYEEVTLGRDARGRISPVRPLLDLHLSWVDAEEEIRLEDWHPQGARELPVTPHTIGPGDTLRALRILRDFGLWENPRK